MLIAEQLKELYTSLRSLIGHASTSEEDCQRWFETNAEVFQALGYRRAIPKPRLYLPFGGYLEPDFLVEDYSGVWSVFELKRPDTVVLKNPSRRTDFRAEFSTYVQQCREYAAFFLDAANRNQVQREYSIEVQRNVPSIIIASTDERTDARVARELLVDRGNLVEVRSYSSVLESIGRQVDVLESHSSSRPGLAAFVLGRFPMHPAVRSQVILDFGAEPLRNRFTVLLSDGTFVLRLYDSIGQEHVLRVERPLVVDFANAHSLTLLDMEFAADSNRHYFGAFLNRHCVTRRFSDRILVEPAALEHVVVGSDLFGKTHADFAAVEIVIYRRTLEWRERAQLYDHFDEVYGYYLSPLAAHRPVSIVFKGHKFFSTQGHPVCPGSLPKEPRVETLNNPQGPWAWYQASGGVRLADGTLPKPDRFLGVQTIPLPGMQLPQAR